METSADRRRAYLREWQSKNKDKVREYSKVWRANNPDKLAEQRKRELATRKTDEAKAARKEWYEKNRVAINAKAREKYATSEELRAVAAVRRKNWYSRNSAAVNAKVIMRRKHIKIATPKWANMSAIISVYENRPRDHHVDHIIPLKGIDPVSRKHVVCGLHVENNLGYLPNSENDSKWAWFSID